MTKELLIKMIYSLMTLKKMGFSKQFVQIEMQECKNLSMKKLYRKYMVMYKRFCERYPEYA